MLGAFGRSDLDDVTGCEVLRKASSAKGEGDAGLGIELVAIDASSG